jgi:hypothetical protein
MFCGNNLKKMLVHDSVMFNSFVLLAYQNTRLALLCNRCYLCFWQACWKHIKIQGRLSYVTDTLCVSGMLQAYQNVRRALLFDSCCLFILVKEKLAQSSDSEISTTSLRISLLCPVSDLTAVDVILT